MIRVPTQNNPPLRRQRAITDQPPEMKSLVTLELSPTSEETIQVNVLAEVSRVEQDAVEDHAVDEPAEEEAGNQGQHPTVGDQLCAAPGRRHVRIAAALSTEKKEAWKTA